jgi:hypothetical protein
MATRKNFTSEVGATTHDTSELILSTREGQLLNMAVVLLLANVEARDMLSRLSPQGATYPEGDIQGARNESAHSGPPLHNEVETLLMDIQAPPVRR